MPSKAFVVNQSEEAMLDIRLNQRSEMVKLALPAGNYALFASGMVFSNDSVSIMCFIETTTRTVAKGGFRLPGAPFLSSPLPPVFGVLSLAATDTVRVNCMMTAGSDWPAGGLYFRLMAISVDAIG
jgi:hypothetical protein